MVANLGVLADQSSADSPRHVQLVGGVHDVSAGSLVPNSRNECFNYALAE